MKITIDKTEYFIEDRDVQKYTIRDLLILGGVSDDDYIRNHILSRTTDEGQMDILFDDIEKPDARLEDAVILEDGARFEISKQPDEPTQASFVSQ